MEGTSERRSCGIKILPCLGFLVGNCCGGSPLNLSTLKVTLFNLIFDRSGRDSIEDIEESVFVGMVFVSKVDEEEEEEEERCETEEDGGKGDCMDGEATSFTGVCCICTTDFLSNGIFSKLLLVDLFVVEVVEVIIFETLLVGVDVVLEEDILPKREPKRDFLVLEKVGTDGVLDSA